VKRYSIQVRAVLAALPSPEERASLERILSNEWVLHIAPTFSETRAKLRASSAGVVICARAFGDGYGWKDVLNELHRMSIPPQLIVADRLADATLWSEVLNLGCYDLLMTPFEHKEVLRVVPMAWDFWRRERERVAARPKPPKDSGFSGGSEEGGQNPMASAHHAREMVELWKFS
jgi:DNA-binding NtrC family response regulator